MAEETTAPPIPRQLESPPRTTGNATQDFPLIIDWIWRAYQIIQQAVNYINDQIEENPDITVTDLPNPQTSTVAQAQLTANQAYQIATLARNTANRVSDILARNAHGTVIVADAADNGTVTFATPQPDANYSVILQAVASAGMLLSANEYVVTSKTYNQNDFSFTLRGAPGIGNSITFGWTLIRNT